jgi:hypothetical protein
MNKDDSVIQSIGEIPTQGDKLSFARKQKKMKTLLETLAPIEQAILDLVLSKDPILDEIAELRISMVDTCIHPVDHLVQSGDVVTCKFCNRRFRLPNEQ